MIVHIFNDQQKFSVGYFHFLQDYGFNLSDTVVYHYGKPSDDFAQYGVCPHFLRSWFLPFGHGRMYRDLKKADRIIVHSLASPLLILLLRIDRELCKKVWWAIWGKDLYFYQVAEKKSIALRLYERLRKPVIRNIGHLMGLAGDIELARKWYAAKGEGLPCYMAYPYSMKYDVGDSPIHQEGEINLLLGNSGSVTNEHKEAIQILSHFKDKLGKVYCPLSYGGPKWYAEEIKRYGIKELGDHFVPLMDFLPLAEYEKIWDDVNIAVFNHNRQEAVTNMYSLILKRKTVYLRPCTTVSSFLKSIGVAVRDFAEGYLIDVLPTEVLDRNAEILFQYISPKKTAAFWAKVLCDHE